MLKTYLPTLDKLIEVLLEYPVVIPSRSENSLPVSDNDTLEVKEKVSTTQYDSTLFRMTQQLFCTTQHDSVTQYDST
jgi:hypothetical protein